MSSFELPWLPSSPQRQEAIQLRNERKYHRLLDDLEHSAVSRQFELEKMGLPRTGEYLITVYRNDIDFPILDYKTRQCISQLIGKRGKTLHSTLQKYNNIAAAMIPPKPPLTWDAITHSDFPSMVELLRGRDDIHSHKWAQEPFRAATQAWLKLQHAKEELSTIGVEARRIWTSIRDEEVSVKEITQAVRDSNPILATYIEMTFKWRLQANARLRKKLSRLESRPNYTSPRGPGTSIASEREPPSNSNATRQSDTVDMLPGSETEKAQQLDDIDDGLLEEEDEEQSQNVIDKLVDLFDGSVIT